MVEWGHQEHSGVCRYIVPSLELLFMFPDDRAAAKFNGFCRWFKVSYNNKGEAGPRLWSKMFREGREHTKNTFFCYWTLAFLPNVIPSLQHKYWLINNVQHVRSFVWGSVAFISVLELVFLLWLCLMIMCMCTLKNVCTQLFVAGLTPLKPSSICRFHTAEP